MLVAAGANDVTGLTRLGSVRDDLEEIVDRLRAARCDVAIVATAAPDVGAAPRLAQPLRAVAGWRTQQVNVAVEDVCAVSCSRRSLRAPARGFAPTVRCSRPTTSTRRHRATPPGCR